MRGLISGLNFPVNPKPEDMMRRFEKMATVANRLPTKKRSPSRGTAWMLLL
jgi:hypothetical protein